MKQTTRTCAFLTLCLFSVLPASAQTPTASGLTPKAPPTQNVSPMKAFEEMRISIDMNDVDSKAALIQLLKPTKFNYDFDRAFYQGSSQGALLLPKSEINLRMQNVRLPNALAALTRTMGIRWSAEVVDGQVWIHFLPPPEGIAALQEMAREAGTSGGLGGGGFGGGFGGGSIALPGSRVKLDSRDTMVKDSLKSILEQARLEFALDDDSSLTEKRPFTFENVTITTALNAICESAGLGWRAEPINNGLLIRVSKRYAPTQP